MQTQLKVRTEFSFKTAYGPVEHVVDYLKSTGCNTAAITDRSSTFGHIAWARHCKLQGIKPIFGVELAFTDDIKAKEKRQNLYWLSLLARSNAGLREIYASVEEATSNFHYVPRLPLSKLDSLSQDVLILSGQCGIGIYNDQLPDKVWIESHPATSRVLLLNRFSVPVSDNYMIRPDNREVYEILIGRGAFNRPSPMHIMTRHELLASCSWLGEYDFTLADNLANECNATIAPATNIIYPEQETSLRLMCVLGAHARGLELTKLYIDRMHYELDLIEKKGFNDYFLVIADMVNYAKQHMLVGPARGSSCGSLVCYLLGITDIDPIPHGLIFERFIDVTRSDLPDIDIDFQDDKRDLVFSYLIGKYGHDKVARIGTISRYKARSAIGTTAKALKISPWEADEISNAVIKREPGDDRSNLCIYDTFVNDDVGRALIKRHPTMMVAAKLESHASHSGTHAAGVVITNEPIANYVARDVRNNTVQIDKYDAEAINLMKVDALGLRTLTIIADCLQQIGWTHANLLAWPINDDMAFDILRKRLFCGIFQFEGYALQGLTRNVAVTQFSDIAALTALARPGPLISGAAHEWVARRMNRKPVELLHEMMENITLETYGLIVYQEQMLRITREIGQLSWEDCQLFRRGINKKLGMEYFDATFWTKFQAGAANNGIDEIVARQIWETVNSAGGYAFNKSHSVAYAMVSYWCCLLKARFPLQFALASLRYNNDPMSIKQYLRELDHAGYQFKVYDAQQSEYDWTVKNNVLIGGLTNVIGIGPKMATAILQRRESDIPLTPGQQKKLTEGKTPYDNVFEGRTYFGDMYVHPEQYQIYSKLWNAFDINDDEGNYVFIAKVVSLKQRSLNETQYLVKRNNLRVQKDRWLNMILEDDSGTIPATISRHEFAKLGVPILHTYKIGDWFLWRGNIKQGSRRVFVEKYRPLVKGK